MFSIGQLIEALAISPSGNRKIMITRAVEALRNVRVATPESRLHDYPHQMSGAMKQRVLGAIAIANTPNVRFTPTPKPSSQRRCPPIPATNGKKSFLQERYPHPSIPHKAAGSIHGVPLS